MDDEWYTQHAAYQDKWPSDSQRAKIQHKFENPLKQSRMCRSFRIFSQIVTFAHVSTRCHLTVSLGFRFFFRGVMTPSLMPAGPDAQHMLDPSSMSVVIVIVRMTCAHEGQPTLMATLAAAPLAIDEVTCLLKDTESVVWGWAEPDHQGATISRYDVRYASEEDALLLDTCSMFVVDSDAEFPSCRIEGLLPGTWYHMMVRAHNEIGVSPWTKAKAPLSGCCSNLERSSSDMR